MMTSVIVARIIASRISEGDGLFMEQKSIRIKHNVAKMEFEVEGPADVVLPIYMETFLERVLGLARFQASEAGFEEIPSPVEVVGQPSVKEFLESFSASRHVDIALVFALYRMIFEGEKTISHYQITEYYKLAGEQPVRNATDVIRKNLRKGYLFHSGKEGRTKLYSLTTAGKAYIEKKRKKR